MSYAEEQRVLIIGELNFFGVGVGEQLLQLLERLARDQYSLLTADAFECFAWLLDEREAMPVGRHHRDRFGLQAPAGRR